MTTPQQPGDNPDRDPPRYPSPPPYEPLAPAPREQGPPTLTIIGAVCAVLALLLCPILFGPAGIVFGYLAHKKGEKFGKWVAVASAVALVLGLIVSLIVYNR
ncbi:MULTISPECIES: hypothetical protein [Nocardia]|uniref:hypothetical protein n=1 Tax=Nocardia TaxID=1817 RepID=UPI0018E51546|nr:MULTISPECIES: hypothetical protein [Nocardia]